MRTIGSAVSCSLSFWRHGMYLALSNTLRLQPISYSGTRSGQYFSSYSI